MTSAAASTEIIARAIHLACRAPSLHNSQPWRWIVGEAAVDLFVDHERVIRSTDRSGREAIISCGAALDHLQIAMAAAGWKADANLFPDPSDRDHLASFDVTPAHDVSTAERDRADAILNRRTDRLPFHEPSHWGSFEPLLRSTIDPNKAVLDVLDDEARPALAQASRLTESVRGRDEYYRDELCWWTDPLRIYQGVPPSALVSEADSKTVGFNRDFPVKQPRARRCDVELDKAKVLVLSTPGASRSDALNCGAALSTVLLECTMVGLATCTVTHINEMADGRAVIQELTGGRAFPQLLIRVGTAAAREETPVPTPRRPSSETMQIRR
jgi:hypothetical protein